MTLEDIIVTNKFGNYPVLYVPGICVLERVIINNMVYMHALNHKDMTGEYLPITTEIEVLYEFKNPTIKILDVSSKFYNYFINLAHYVRATAENRLITQAFNKTVEYIIADSKGTLITNMPPASYVKILGDGSYISTGYIASENTSVGFIYIEDILYRLDLQGKVP